jgi:zinc D-Ala-D-Ala carboxypeptidase
MRIALAGDDTVIRSLKEKLLSLGVTDTHIERCKMPRHIEALSLASSGTDIFDRTQNMTPLTLHYWTLMKTTASQQGIELRLVSAFRSYDYQCRLIANKLEKGQSIDQVLTVNAIPGFSEHHTGRALDLTDTECEPLHEAFEETDAFGWLTNHAAQFHFHMSYPRANPQGITFEPWHWCCHATG